MNNNIALLDYQYDFLKLNIPNAAMIAGVGTGKTLAIAYAVIHMVSSYPDTKGMIVANTYSQLVNSTLEPLFEVLKELNIPYRTNIAGKYIIINNTKIYVYSLEKYDNIRGIEVGWIFADELAYQKDKKAYDTIKTRLRCKHGPLIFRAFSTKNGFNWFYDLYSSPIKTNDYQVIEAQTIDNIFLPPQYLEDLLIDYGSIDAPMYRQEVLNEYVNLTEGSVYYGFNRDKHVQDCSLIPYKHVYIGVDFNIDSMSAVYCQYVDDTLYVCKEVSLTDANSNTFTLANKLQQDLAHCHYRSVIPDSTGKARKTSSAKTDHQILIDAGFKLDVTNNPRVRDRQNTVNRLFNLDKVIIDPSCKNLIRELETLASRDKEGSCVHVSVAFGYVSWRLAPLKTKQPKSITRAL